MSFKIATANLPAGNKGSKAHLLKHPRRTNRAATYLKNQGVEACALQELATVGRVGLRARNQRVLAAPFNNRGLPILGNVGNAVSVRRDIKAEELDPIRLSWGRLGLHLPVVALENRAGEKLTMVSVHLPAGPDNWYAREQMIDSILHWANKRVEGPVVFAGDYNTWKVPEFLEETVGDWHAKGHGVDWFVYRGCKLRNFEVHKKYVNGVFTDHPILTAEVIL